MIPELRDTIDRLLWYVPGISSYQSEDNYLVDDELYSYPIFEDVLSAIGLELEKDINLLDQKKLPDDLNAFYSDRICLNCQKVILTKYNNETWLRSLLRHIRNSIAHGMFTVVGNFVLFIDKLPKSEDPTAFLKINAVLFNKALKVLDDFAGVTRSSSAGLAEERIIKRVFENKVGNIIADLIVVKNDKKYAIELKRGTFKPIGFQDESIQKIDKMLNLYLLEGYIPILIYDRGWLTPKASDYLKDKQYIVLDKKDLNNFFKGDMDTVL
jgi:hypothetical protein